MILSEFAGAAVELHGALLVNPYDANAMSETLYQALTMSEDEIAYRSERLAMIVEEHDVTRWGEGFLAALDKEAARQEAPAADMDERSAA